MVAVIVFAICLAVVCLWFAILSLPWWLPVVLLAAAVVAGFVATFLLALLLK